jgi:hypothetical protein
VTAAERMASMSRQQLCAVLKVALDATVDSDYEYLARDVTSEEVLDRFLEYVEAEKAEIVARLRTKGNDHE